MAFVSFSNNNTRSTNGAVNTAQAVNTAHEVSTASTQVNAVYSINIDNLSDAVICLLFASQPNSPKLVHEDLEQIHPDDMKKMDLRLQMAMLTMRAKWFLKKTGRKLTVNGNETIGFDKSNVDSDSDVSNDSTCLKSCFETFKLLKYQNDQLLKDLKKFELMVLGEIAIRKLKKKLEIAQKEKDGIQLNNAVPSPNTGNFMPPTTDLSFTGLDEFVNKPIIENCKAKSGEEEPKDQGVIDSGCSRYMTGNMSYPIDYEEIDRGYVAFGGNPKGGKITGKVVIKDYSMGIMIRNKARWVAQGSQTASTPMETQKPLLKDEDGEEVDVHMYSDYAGASMNRKSTTGGCQFLRCRLISWQYVKEIVNTESSVIRDLQLADEEGIDCLPNSTSFEQLALMGVELSRDKESLGEDASKQGRIGAIDADEDITMVSVQDDADKEMFDVNVLDVEVIKTTKLLIDAGEVSTACVSVSAATTISAATTTTAVEEVTLAQALKAL
nr:hypothetical protein [Tanacetum cinerariifolium]